MEPSEATEPGRPAGNESVAESQTELWEAGGGRPGPLSSVTTSEPLRKGAGTWTQPMER